MKKSIKLALLICLLLVNGSLLFSQETRIELGDKYFAQHAYNKAIPFFEGANKTREIYAKLGDCYYYTSQTEKAVMNYLKAFENNRAPKKLDQYRLRFALCLLSTGNKEQSLEEFKKYYKDDDDITKLKIRAVDPTNMDMAENLSINSKNSDFGAFVYRDTLYFASSREIEKKRKHNKELYKWNELPFLEIYTAAINRSDGLVTYKFIPSDSSNIGFKTPAHEASVAIINDNTMYFSGGTVNRKNKIDYNKRGVSNLKLQKAMLKDHKWVLDVEGTKQLDFLNLENYSVGNPAFSPDNKRLFFVSCAPYPDAKGQSDIYYTDIMVDGSFGPVKNVPGINTGGRESFPFVSSDGTLYFSSDGFYNYELGLGLLDIYKVENINKVIQIAEEASNNNQQIEIVVEHLEAPFNSPKDDFAFFIEKPNGINSVAYAYFSSNREHPEAQCDDDIYRVRLSVSKSAEQK
jgi:tetratricopeptide (TPR) repeat protein